jgi:hypothetical protein
MIFRIRRGNPPRGLVDSILKIMSILSECFVFRPGLRLLW